LAKVRLAIALKSAPTPKELWLSGLLRKPRLRWERGFAFGGLAAPKPRMARSAIRIRTIYWTVPLLVAALRQTGIWKSPLRFDFPPCPKPDRQGRNDSAFRQNAKRSQDFAAFSGNIERPTTLFDKKAVNNSKTLIANGPTSIKKQGKFSNRDSRDGYFCGKNRIKRHKTALFLQN
jgi:hypothetical protein